MLDKPGLQLYLVEHYWCDNSFDPSIACVYSDHVPAVEEAVLACQIDFEPDRGETIEISLFETEKGFPTVPYAKVPEFPKAVIFVQGGVVTGCTGNDARLKVVLVDCDNLKEEEDEDEAETKALEGTEDCTHDVY